jgi:predicted nucleic acid-binding protein
LRPVWEAARQKKIKLIGSELLIIETLTGPLKKNIAPLVSAYDQILKHTDLNLLPISGAILRDGASIRANYGLKTPDAIHAATSLSAGCSMFLTNDVGFERVPRLAPTILSRV